MHIKNKIIKRLICIAGMLAIIGAAYLIVLPAVLNYTASRENIKELINAKNNAIIEYQNPKFKTYIKPYISLSLDKLKIHDKEDSYSLIDADNILIKISILDLLRKKINIKQIKSQNVILYVFQDENGNFNFENIFPKNSKSSFNIIVKNNNINIDNYSATFEDKNLKKATTITGKPFVLEIMNKEKIILKSKGYISADNKQSDFDINISSKLPISKKTIPELISGKFFIYNIDLDMISPYIKKYIDNTIKTLSGEIEYIQLSTTNNESGKNQIVLNSLFKNVVFDKKNAANNLVFKGENNIHANIELSKDTIYVNSLQFEADNVNVKADGEINASQEKPTLDVNAEIIKSKAENITAMLPEILTAQLGTIEKIKNYGVYGDVEGKINIKGTIPQPDITGFVKGKNIHVLEKSIHNLHKGTVYIVFNKRILNMDILVNLFDNQSAKVNGYVYMYRDGINNVSVKTTDNIDFPLAQKIIIPISKVFNFQLGPIPEMDIQTGKGIIDINIKGSMDFISINGYSAFRQASLLYNGLFGRIDKGKGRLDFKDDIVSFKSEEAYVKTNPLSVEGKVKINDNLDFNISSINANAQDILEIINKSSLLKDVKDGIAIITDANGIVKLFVNIKAKIVPVPFGQPPLPPDEAFEDMKVKGSLYLLSNSCYIEGFKTPLEKLKGIVDFTETVVDLQSINAISGTSPLTINGQIITDLNTKIPDVDITITSKEVKLKDTIRFLTLSYLYPENYPDLSSLYKIASKHDLYFKYKAKSIDFETDKAYAVMNFIPDNEDNPIKAKSGRIIMDKATVKVDNINASLYDSNLLITGNVFHVDTLTPEYNLKIKTDNFNLENLNDTSKITIMPEDMRNIFKQFVNYSGFADIDISIDKNILNGNVYLKSMKMMNKATKIPLSFDNFNVYFKDNKILLNNITANIDDIPFFGNLTIENYYVKPAVNGYFTSKLTNKFLKTYLPANYAEKIDLNGDISLSAKINGTQDNLYLEPKLILNPNADVSYDKTNIGEINEKREFNGKINIEKDKILIKGIEYIKYISSQNNKTYPIVFMNAAGILRIDNDKIEPEEFWIKTNKNLPARILNILLKSPVLTQGTFNCDLKFKSDAKNKTSKIIGEIDCRNLDIPLFDTIIKNIRMHADDNNIKLSMFGFISDAKINIKSEIKNNFTQRPRIESLNIYADRIDRNKLFASLSKTHNAMNTNNKIKNIDLNGLSISNGHLEVKELTVKSLTANNFISDFSIDEKGIFTANNMTLDVGQGNILGTLSYNLTDTAMTGDFELNNVDSNYIAETLFEGKNQISGNANGKLYLKTKGSTDEERIKNLSGFVYFDINDGKMLKLGSLEYLLRASNIIKSGITGFTINSILELLNLVKTGYFSNINGSCTIENGIAQNIEIFSKGENLSLYIHGTYDIARTNAELEILGKLSKRISTIFGTIGNTSLNTFFKLIPGISLFDFSRKNFIEDVEKIPSFTNGDYESRIFQAIINGDINDSGYVQSFKWVQ